MWAVIVIVFYLVYLMNTEQRRVVTDRLDRLLAAATESASGIVIYYLWLISYQHSC